MKYIVTFNSGDFVVYILSVSEFLNSLTSVSNLTKWEVTQDKLLTSFVETIFISAFTAWIELDFRSNC